MLPHGLLTIPQIQREQHAGSKMVHLAKLLEYVLKLYNPNVTAADEGKDPKVGERVIACQHLFNDVSHVLWALKVRNSFAHVIESASFSERDHRNAVDYLIEAIGDVCRQSTIPRNLVAEIYYDPGADLRGRQEEEDREKRTQAEQAQKLRAQELKLEEERRRQAQRERELREKRSGEKRMALRSAFRWLVFLILLGVGGTYLWPKLVVLYKGDISSAAVVRTEAGLALKKVREKRKQREYGAIITQAEAAWRDGEIEFQRGYYRRAEDKYRQLLSLWDNLNARIAESLSFEELLAEVNKLRQAAKSSQAPEKAADLWNQAEETRRNAETARRNGDLANAKSLIIQARQQYETAQAAALTQIAEPATGDKANGGAPETTPTALPEPLPTPTAVAQPTVEKKPEPEPAPPAGRDADDDTVTIDEKEFMQYVTRKVDPVIPAEAGAAGVSGPVVIEVYLSRYGHLSKAWVVEGDPLLREAALAALRQWSFRPYLRDRVPIDIRSRMTIYVRSMP